MRYANWMLATAAGVGLSLAGSGMAQTPNENRGVDRDFPLSKALGGSRGPEAAKPEDGAKAKTKSATQSSDQPVEEGRKARPTPASDARASESSSAAESPSNSGLLLRGSQLPGLPIRNAGGQTIGKVVDVVGDANGQNQFAVVSLKGDDRMIVLPYSGLRLQPGGRGGNFASLRVASTKLKNAPSFVGDEWPTFDPKYSGWVTSFYSELLPAPAAKSAGGRNGAAGKNQDYGLSDGSSIYPNPTQTHAGTGAPGANKGAASPGSPLPPEPSTSRSPADLRRTDSGNGNAADSPRLPGGSAPGTPGTSSGTPAPGGSGPGGSVPGGTGGAPGGTGSGGAAGGTSGSGGSSSSGS